MRLPKAAVIPRAKDCRLHPLAYAEEWVTWLYYVPCPCCDEETVFVIHLYDSGRYWLMTGHEVKIGWGKTLAEAKRKARELDRKAWWNRRRERLQNGQGQAE